MCSPSLHTCTQLTLAWKRRLSPLLTHPMRCKVHAALHALVRTAAHSLWNGEGPELTDAFSQRVQVAFSWRPGVGLQPQRDMAYRMGGNARAVTAWAGQTVY
jgi:hypothetical protein